jgi:hypothetical protein
LRIAELRVLAAQTAVEFWREQQQHGLASLRLQLLVRSAMKRGRIDPTRRAGRVLINRLAVSAFGQTGHRADIAQ